MRLRSGLIGFIAVIQTVLFLAHFLLYQTWTYALPSDARSWWIQVIVGILSVSFVTASLLAFRYTNGAIRIFYRAAAIWLGLLTFLVSAAGGAWILLGLTHAAGMELNFHRMLEVLFAAAAGVGLVGVFNASWTRVTRATVRLANLPEAWRGRKAALISDLHLGHVR